MVHSNITVRHYSEEDLPLVLAWYESIPQLAPQFSRDECLLQHLAIHPGVRGDGILIAIDSGHVAGLAVIAINEDDDLTQANILELRAQNEDSLELLKKAAVDYCVQNNADAIIATPLLPESADRVFSDWARLGHTTMMCKTLAVLPLLRAALDIEKVRNSFAGKEFLFLIDGLFIHVQISSSTVKLSQVQSLPERSTVQIIMSSQTLLKVIFGMANVYFACISRKIEIKGLSDAPAALGLLQVMKQNKPWAISIGDAM